MVKESEPTQAMPTPEEDEQEPRPTQPTSGHEKPAPKKDEENFGGHMGTGGQSIMGYEGPEQSDEEGDNPNAAADPD